MLMIRPPMWPEDHDDRPGPSVTGGLVAGFAIFVLVFGPALLGYILMICVLR